MSFIEAISVWLKETLLPFGGFGLMAISVGDSSFLSLPEVNDLLLMTFSVHSPSSMLKLAALTTLGSIIGCSLLFAVGRRGGEALLRGRFADHRLLRVRGWYDKYGVLAVIIPSLLPPPTPFKIFVLSAGAFGTPWPRFLAAVAIGRGIRYFSEGFLAVTYGEAAQEFVRQNFGTIGILISLCIIAGVVVYIVARRKVRSIEA
jgi:membrane protein YqaA with SNARE-associated domain